MQTVRGDASCVADFEREKRYGDLCIDKSSAGAFSQLMNWLYNPNYNTNSW